MAVTSKELRSARPRHAVRGPVQQRGQLAFYGVTVLTAAVAVYLVVGVVFSHGRTLVDDLRYGRPRMFQITAFVGHNEASGSPTHLMALNLNRQVVIVELPGGDPSQPRTIRGPYLFGASEDLTPVLLHLEDLDRDGNVDLLVDVRQEQVVYLNRDGAFRLPTAEEQARLLAVHP